ncbi:MAG: CPBP family intramembrane glutamic endopeptidase [Promethearchaeota archaeon]
MKMREWFENHTLLTGIILVVIFSLTVGNIYVRLSNQIISDIGITGVTNVLLSISVRFLISTLTLFLLIPYLFYRTPRNAEMYARELKFSQGNSWKQTITIGFISFTIFAVVSGSILLALGIFTDDPFIFLKNPTGSTGGWLWLLVAINPAIFEEMAFRGVLFSTLEKEYTERRVIWMTAVLFGLFHFTGLANGETIIGVILTAIMATTFALSWGYMNVKTNSVVPSMIVHYFINALSEVFKANTTEDVLILLQIIGITILYPILSILAIKIIMKDNEQEVKNPPTA